MTTGKMIGRLRALKASVLADGKVDWNETEQLLQAIRPLAASALREPTSEIAPESL